MITYFFYSGCIRLTQTANTPFATNNQDYTYHSHTSHHVGDVGADSAHSSNLLSVSKPFVDSHNGALLDLLRLLGIGIMGG